MRKILITIMVLFTLSTSAHADTIEQAVFSPYDITVQSKVDLDTFKRVLNKHGIGHMAEDFFYAEDSQQINVFFLVASGALESGWYQVPAAANNYWGQMYYNRRLGRYVGIPYNSTRHALEKIGNNLKTNYFDMNSSFYTGPNIYNIQKVWCPGNPIWARDIVLIANKLKNEYNAMI